MISKQVCCGMGGVCWFDSGFRGEGWAGDAMAVDRVAPGVCERGAVPVVPGLTGVIWQEGCYGWETRRWSR